MPAPDGLQAVGSGLWVATAASGKPAPVTASHVVQHALEGSSVDLADAMTELIEAQRAFELASKAVQTQDQLRQIANDIRR